MIEIIHTHPAVQGGEPVSHPDPVRCVEDVFNDPPSRWLQEALIRAFERDPVDALNDALALADLLEGRLRQALDLDGAPDRP